MRKMNKLIKYIQCGALAVTLLLTSCFQDGLDECADPNNNYSYIKFLYKYNTAFVDKFHLEVSKIDVFLFDDQDVYIQKLTDQTPDGTPFGEKYYMGLPEAYKDARRFVAFGGLYEDQIISSSMVPKQSTLNDLYAQLSPRTNNVLNRQIHPLFHGSTAQQQTSLNKNDTTTIELTKDYYTVRIVLQPINDELKVNVEDFYFVLESANGKYDAYNNVTSDAATWYYQPYSRKNETGRAIVEMNTLRLMENAGENNRLKVIQLADNNTLLDINLNDYILAFKLDKYGDMPFQEYLDREDEFRVGVFIEKDKDDPKEAKWVATMIEINDWVVRDQDKGRK